MGDSDGTKFYFELIFLTLGFNLFNPNLDISPLNELLTKA